MVVCLVPHAAAGSVHVCEELGRTVHEITWELYTKEYYAVLKLKKGGGGAGKKRKRGKEGDLRLEVGEKQQQLFMEEVKFMQTRYTRFAEWVIWRIGQWRE